MTVMRIVANIATGDIAAVKRFYHDVLGLDVLMNHGWIATYGSSQKMDVEISLPLRAAPARPCRTFPSRSTMSMRRSPP